MTTHFLHPLRAQYTQIAPWTIRLVRKSSRLLLMSYQPDNLHFELQSFQRWQDIRPYQCVGLRKTALGKRDSLLLFAAADRN